MSQFAIVQQTMRLPFSFIGILWSTTLTCAHKERVSHNCIWKTGPYKTCTFVDFTRNWKTCYYNDDQMREFMQMQFRNSSILSVFENSDVIMKTDIWRLAVLWKLGGLYLDMDLAPSKTFEEKIPEFTSSAIMGNDKVNTKRPDLCYLPGSAMYEAVAKHTGRRMTIQQDRMMFPRGHIALCRALTNIVRLFHDVCSESRSVLRPGLLNVHNVVCMTGPFVLDVSIRQHGGANIKFVDFDWGGALTNANLRHNCSGRKNNYKKWQQSIQKKGIKSIMHCEMINMKDITVDSICDSLL